MSIRDEYVSTIKSAFDRSAYGQWVKEEGVRDYQDFAVENLGELELAPWPRLGGSAIFLDLYPMMEGARGMYVAEIPPGRALEPEHHLYEKIVMILQGQGTTEIWQEGEQAGLATGRGQAGPGAGGESQVSHPLMAVGPADSLSAAGPARHVFEWGRGSVFSPPLNTWHRMYNVGREPARFLAITTAPQMMNGFRDVDFIFHCPYAFRTRYDGEETYFAPGQKHYMTSSNRTASNLWETNFIPDALEALLDPNEVKAHGNYSTQFEMSGNSLIGHIAQWPVGRYHKAHFHGPAALLMGLRSEGYVLLWPKELGIRPYENGKGDEVLQVPWGVRRLYTPPSGWFHQHFNTGKEPARHIAVRYGSRLHGPGFGFLERRHGDLEWSPNLTSIGEGGTLIDYEDEDPEIRQRYQQALKGTGVAFEMPEAIYRPGAAKTWRDQNVSTFSERMKIVGHLLPSGFPRSKGRSVISDIG